MSCSILGDPLPIVERPFEIPIGVLEVGEKLQLPGWPEPQQIDVIHVAWSGRIDLAAKVNGRNRVVDHKTTSVAGEQFIPSFQLSYQTQGYVWAAQQLWPELLIDSFCLDAIYLKRPGVNGHGFESHGEGTSRRATGTRFLPRVFRLHATTARTVGGKHETNHRRLHSLSRPQLLPHVYQPLFQQIRPVPVLRRL